MDEKGGGGVKQPERARDGDEWKGIGVSGEGRERKVGVKVDKNRRR